MPNIIRYTTFLISFIGCLTVHTAVEADQDQGSKWSMARFRLALTKGGAPSIETLEQQEIRRQAINIILDTYQLLNSKGRYASHKRKEDLYVGPHWEYLPIEERRTPAGQPIWALLPKLNTIASKCFSDLHTSPEFVLECMSASLIACARIFETFSPKANKGAIFDESFFTSEEFLANIARRHGTKICPFLRFTTITGSYFFDQEFKEGAAHIEPADYIYLGGHPEYSKRHPLGYGSGDFFKDGPKIAQEIQKELAKEYRGKNCLEEEIPHTDEDLAAALQDIRKVPANHKKFLVNNVEELRKRYPPK
jgi:hypothetical protein